MESSGQKLTDNWRILAVCLVFVIGIFFLLFSLRDVQVVRTDNFSADLRRQSIRRVQVPGARGRIFDRNGECLADNRASYCIAYYVEELRRRGKWTRTIDAVNQSIDRFAVILGVPRMVSYAQVTNHVMQSLPMPLLAWRDIGQETLARWAAHADEFPEVDIYVQPERRYPKGTLANHLLGYVGRDKPKPLPGEKVHYFLPEMVGRAGMEKQANADLTGIAGGRLIRVDARGYKNMVLNDVAATPGKDIYLTIDCRLQEALEKALRGYCGAGAVVDPRNGEILALASAPSYDPNEFVPILREGIWKRLNENPQRPLLNRAIQGRYAPGSTFKTITALAALQSGYSPHAVYDCQGMYTLGPMKLRCWDGYGHGPIELRKAIEQSCNAFFCNMGYTIGYDAIYRAAKSAGLGVATGIDLPAEDSGLLPTPDWKMKRMKMKWNAGDTCHISIGQGLLLTTPLQMAFVSSLFANGGTRMKPQLRLHTPSVWNRYDAVPQQGVPTQWPKHAVDLVRTGMRDVATLGTGRRTQTNYETKQEIAVQVAAKTGTAEFDVRGERHKNTWVIAFAPYDSEASLALAIVVENGESGGKTAAPMAYRVFAEAFGEVPVHREEEEPHTDDEQPTPAPPAPEPEETGTTQTSRPHERGTLHGDNLESHRILSLVTRHCRLWRLASQLPRFSSGGSAACHSSFVIRHSSLPPLAARSYRQGGARC